MPIYAAVRNQAERTPGDIVRKIKDTHNGFRDRAAKVQDVRRCNGSQLRTEHAPDETHADTLEEAGSSSGFGAFERLRRETLEAASDACDE